MLVLALKWIEIVELRPEYAGCFALVIANANIFDNGDLVFWYLCEMIDEIHKNENGKEA